MYKNSDARQRVLNRLLEGGPSTVADLASELGVVPVTMRSHLQALQEQGLVTSEDERGHVGRPRRRYRLSAEAHDRLPNRNGALAADFLAGLQALAGSRGVDQLLDVAAARAASRHAPALSGRPFADRVAVAADILEKESGRAGWEDAGDRFVIRDYHCPYGELARQRPEVCRYHTQVVARLLGAQVSLEQSIVRGDAHCVFSVARQPVQPPIAVRTLSDGRLAPQRS